MYLLVCFYEQALIFNDFLKWGKLRQKILAFQIFEP